MSLCLWKSEDDNINLGSPLAVFDVFKELAQVIPALKEQQFPDLLAIPLSGEQELGKETFQRIGRQAQRALKAYGKVLSPMAKDLLKQLVKETGPRTR